MFKLFLDAISSRLSDSCFYCNAPLKHLTTMRVGGNAACLVEADNVETIKIVLSAAKEYNVPLLVIGNGSNMVISDDGFEGVVLHLSKEISAVACDGLRITAQAGALLPGISRIAAENSLTGLEFASGIPGSLGGAVVMNAGAYGGEMKHIIEDVTVLADGELKVFTAEEMNFGYRHSLLMEHPDWIVISATLVLEKGDRREIIAKMNDLSARRREKQPLQYPSSGSFFKRPEGYFAGALIEQSNLKGFSVGGAQVSELHAGFVINTGNATASDIYQLMHHVQKTVFNNFHVKLEPEVRLIGRFEK